MVLRTALVIDGNSEGAKKAASETSTAIKDVDKAAGEASKSTNSIAGNLDRANQAAGGAAKGLKDAGEAAGTLARPLGEAGKAAGEAEKPLANVGRAANDLGKITVTPEQEKFRDWLFGLGDNASKAEKPLQGVMSFLGGLAGGVIGGAISGAFESALTAIGSYALGAISKTDEINATIKGHVSLIKEIKGAYKDAGDGASDYGSKSVNIFRFQAQQNLTRLQGAYQDALPGGGLFNTGAFASGTGGFNDQQLGPYADVVRKFRQELAQGKADVIAFRDEVSRIGAEQPADSSFRTLAETMLSDTEKASEVLSKLRAAKDALGLLNGDVDAGVRLYGGAAEKFGELSGAAGNAVQPLGSAAQAIGQTQTAAAGAAAEVQNLITNLQNVPKTIPAAGIPSVTPSPSRGAANPSLVPFALGGIVDRPTMFGYGDGETGLMGEAGQEAILPMKGGAIGARTAGGKETRLNLVRLSDGSLGVDVPKTFAYGGVVSMRGGGAYGGGYVQRDRRGRFVSSGGYGGYGDDPWGGVYSAVADGLRGVITGVFDSVKTGDFSGFWEKVLGVGVSVAERLFGQMVDQAVDGLIGAFRGNGGFGGGAASGAGGGWGSLIGSFFGGGGSNWFPSVPGGLYAKGGVFGAGINAFSNQIVDRPTLFAFAHGAGLMGEAGPEAIVPLSRDGNGRLGISAFGGSSGGVSLTIVNNSSVPVSGEVEETDDGQGRRQFRLVMSDAVADGLSAPGGRAGRTMQDRYGVRRRGVRRS